MMLFKQIQSLHCGYGILMLGRKSGYGSSTSPIEFATEKPLLFGCSEEGVQAAMRTVQEWKDQLQAWVLFVPSPFVVSIQYTLGFKVL